MNDNPVRIEDRLPLHFRCLAAFSVRFRCAPFSLFSSPGDNSGSCRRMESSKLELPDMIERREKCLEVPAVAQDTKYQTPAGLHDLTRYLDEGDQEPLEFHPQDLAPGYRRQSDQAIPGLEIPSQRGDNHVSPI